MQESQTLTGSALDHSVGLAFHDIKLWVPVSVSLMSEYLCKKN